MAHSPQARMRLAHDDHHTPYHASFYFCKPLSVHCHGCSLLHSCVQRFACMHPCYAPLPPLGRTFPLLARRGEARSCRPQATCQLYAPPFDDLACAAATGGAHGCALLSQQQGIAGRGRWQAGAAAAACSVRTPGCQPRHGPLPRCPAARMLVCLSVQHGHNAAFIACSAPE